MIHSHLNSQNHVPYAYICRDCTVASSPCLSAQNLQVKVHTRMSSYILRKEEKKNKIKHTTHISLLGKTAWQDTVLLARGVGFKNLFKF